jgi:predicted metal-dependent hydrolase
VRQLDLFLIPEAPPAQRFLTIAGRAVEYRFVRRKRRTIGISVDADGLAIAAPRRASWRDIEAFVQEKARWILRCLDEWAARPRPAPLRGVDGETLPLFGEPLQLEVRAGRAAVSRSTDRLLLRVRHPERQAAVLAALVRWLRRETLVALVPRAAHYATQLDLPAPRVSISNARTQWGVCSASGEIRLSWRLAHVAPSLADYVVAHEVAHLVELNHSKRFWQVVESLYPGWRDARERLEQVGACLPRLGNAR